jgi:ApaG protein
MYEEVTHGIRISVEPTFLAEKSQPKAGLYYFAYRVRIQNEREEPTQLVSRHWLIRDGKGATHEVKGDGVIGLQPVLAPGEIFEYSSFCPLPTPTGSMRGTYLMQDPAQQAGVAKTYVVKIPLFFLRDLSQFH